MTGIEQALANWGAAGGVLVIMISLIKYLSSHHSRITESVLDVVNKNTEALTSFKGEIVAHTASNVELSRKIGKAVAQNQRTRK